MKISYRWLLELTGLDWPVEKVAERLTLCGTACEEIVSTARYMDRVVIGKVLKVEAVEGADKIRKVTVDVGNQNFALICGAPNVAEGQLVPVAREGARLAGDLVIKKIKIRGVESRGMICSERELAISDDHSGIWVLDDDLEVGHPLAEQLDYDDYVMTFELTPNRADSMSAIGIARDLAALASVKLLRPSCDPDEEETAASSFIRVAIDDTVACPRYSARIIKDVKIAPSPWWVKKKLLACGIRPISNVVDVTNLVMLECGHPLHAFDLKRFGSGQVLVRMAQDGEEFTTIDGQQHKLTPDVILITNGSRPVAAGGVMGGMDSEIKDDTSDILLEAAYFDPSRIRKSRRQLGLVTESSMRFEKGADPNGIEYAINRAAALFGELCQGKVQRGIVDCYPKKIESVTISFRPARCNAVLGTKFEPSRMRQIFSDLELKSSGNEVLEVTVPTFRPDLEREIDLIEEVARMEGYDKIPDSVTNIGPLLTPSHYEDSFMAELRIVLTSAGFDEILGHGLAGSDQAILLNPDLPQLNIANPVSEDLNIMRNCLALTAFSVVEYNLSHRNMDLQLFEIGKAYFPPDKNGNWVEEQRLSLALAGNSDGHWRLKPRPLDFYDLTAACERVTEHFRLPPFEYLPVESDLFAPDQSFDIRLKGNSIGLIGRVSETLARKFGIKHTVYLAEIILSSFIERGRPSVESRSLPIFPAAPRDLALVVSESVKAADIVATVKLAAGELAESVSIFDLYAGDQIESGKKSIAIAISYRSSKGNLSSEEVDEKQGQVISALKKKFEADIRDK